MPRASLAGSLAPKLAGEGNLNPLQSNKFMEELILDGRELWWVLSQEATANPLGFFKDL